MDPDCDVHAEVGDFVCVYVCMHMSVCVCLCMKGDGKVGHKRPVKWLFNHNRELALGSSMQGPEEPTNESFPGKFQHVTTCFTQLSLIVKRELPTAQTDDVKR